MPTREQAVPVRLPPVHGLMRIVGYNLWSDREWIILEYTPGDVRLAGAVIILAEIMTVTQAAWRSPNQMQQDPRPPRRTCFPLSQRPSMPCSTSSTSCLPQMVCMYQDTRSAEAMGQGASALPTVPWVTCSADGLLEAAAENNFARTEARGSAMGSASPEAMRSAAAAGEKEAASSSAHGQEEAEEKPAAEEEEEADADADATMGTSSSSWGPAAADAEEGTSAWEPAAWEPSWEPGAWEPTAWGPAAEDASMDTSSWDPAAEEADAAIEDHLAEWKDGHLADLKAQLMAARLWEPAAEDADATAGTSSSSLGPAAADATMGTSSLVPAADADAAEEADAAEDATMGTSSWVPAPKTPQMPAAGAAKPRTVLPPTGPINPKPKRPKRHLPVPPPHPPPPPPPRKE